MSNIQLAKIQQKANISNKKKTSLKLILQKKDMILLERYAKINKLTPKKAAKKILKEYLATNVSLPEDIAVNQLDLFSPIETDIFDFTK